MGYLKRGIGGEGSRIIGRSRKRGNTIFVHSGLVPDGIPQDKSRKSFTSMLLETQWNGMVSNRYEMQQPPFCLSEPRFEQFFLPRS